MAGTSSKRASATRTRTLDPDVLAQLETERDFLLRSLDDLDAEHAAGDLDAHDYQQLSDDYTRRLAEVHRSIKEQRTAFAAVENKLSSRQRILTVLAVVAIALLAGILLGRASGFRSPEDSTTGDIRQSSTGLLSEADALIREGRLPEAIDTYTEALELSPANAEALTYRGWLRAQTGEGEAGLADLAEATAVDPEYPDARVFQAILLANGEQFDAASEQLAALDALDTPDEMLGLIQASDLRATVAAGQIRAKFAPGESVDLSQVDASLDDVARAGALLSQQGESVLSVAAFDAVLEQDPDQIVALVGRGQLARQPDIVREFPDLAADALAVLDRAVEVDPESAAIRLYRADARSIQGNHDGARDDLAAIDETELSPELLALYTALNDSLS